MMSWPYIIVDLPIDSMVIFHSNMLIFRRVSLILDGWRVRLPMVSLLLHCYSNWFIMVNHQIKSQQIAMFRLRWLPKSGRIMIWLVTGTMEFYDLSHWYWECKIIPTDSTFTPSFFRGVASEKPPTSDGRWWKMTIFLVRDDEIWVVVLFITGVLYIYSYMALVQYIYILYKSNEDQWFFPCFFPGLHLMKNWGIAKLAPRRQVLKLLKLRLRSTAGKMGRMENPKAFWRGNVMEISWSFLIFLFWEFSLFYTFLYFGHLSPRNVFQTISRRFSRLNWVALRCFFFFRHLIFAAFSLQGRAAPKALRTEMDIGLLQPARIEGDGKLPWRYCHWIWGNPCEISSLEWATLQKKTKTSHTKNNPVKFHWWFVEYVHKRCGKRGVTLWF